MNPLSAIPVMHVSDLEEAVGFYTKVLGFTESFRYGTYCGVKMGGCEIHITLPDHSQPRAGGGCVYVICDEVDEFHSSVVSRSGECLTKPEDRVYGFRDFTILDPDGNKVTFGQDLE